MGNKSSSITDGTPEEIGNKLYNETLCKNEETAYARQAEKSIKILRETGCDVLSVSATNQCSLITDKAAEEIDEYPHNETICENEKTFSKVIEKNARIAREVAGDILRAMAISGAKSIYKSFMAKSRLFLIACPFVGVGAAVCIVGLNAVFDFIDPQLNANQVSEIVSLALRREISIQKGMKLFALLQNCLIRFKIFKNNNTKIQKETNKSERKISRHITFVAEDIKYYPNELNLLAWATGAFFHLCMCEILIEYEDFDREILVEFVKKYKSDLDLLSKKVEEKIILKKKNYVFFKKVIFIDELEKKEYTVKFSRHLKDDDVKKIIQTFLKRRLWDPCNQMKEWFQSFIDELNHNAVTENVDSA
ncbi:uncharacterized protein LOC122808848 isoform X2 [Protopterus annectens]|uniref:uncharacterized protein LOC122808848 isoform X2 n=1 Tax=Protopterus annectens TaxID=7888 RepID=UPI001CFA3DD3|nr:uncharacterized protein LOC122808848 isoform X2 [Protopterus annectens]